jgi:hypothetical protein
MLAPPLREPEVKITSFHVLLLDSFLLWVLPWMHVFPKRYYFCSDAVLNNNNNNMEHLSVFLMCL